MRGDVNDVAPTPTGRADSTISPHGIYQIPMQAYHATGHHPGPHLPFQSTSDDGSPTQSEATPTMHYGLGTTGGSHMPAPGTSTNHTFERVQFKQATANNGKRRLPFQSTSDDGSPTQSEATPTMHYGLGTTGGSHMPAPGTSTNHTFERVQFKQATANNGKRRASQQYFHLVVELFVDIRKDEHDDPSWVKIAQRVSEKIVVRGRSPSHYQNEGHNGTAGRGGATGS